MKIVYSYDENTKEYTGTTIAQEDFRASKATGVYVYMMPDNSTWIEPPTVEKNQIAVFNINNDTWDIKLDYRNEIVYNLITREPLVIKEIGDIPLGYVKELPERIEDLKVQLLFDMKSKFVDYLGNTKVFVNNNTFYYSSLSRLIKERDINITISRDDSNNIYTYTKEDYNNVIIYLTVFGQLLYISKWKLEKEIINCNYIETLKEYKNKIAFTVDEEDITMVASLTPTKRKNYFVKLANSIK